MWDFEVLQVIRRARSDLHSHGALQLTVGLEAPLRMGSGLDHEVRGAAILVAANEPHWFESDGWAAAFWIEPESRVGRGLADQYLQVESMVALPETPVAALREELLALAQSRGAVAHAEAARRALAAAWLPDAGPVPPLHPALRRAIRHISGLDEVRVSAADLAATAGVSESHLLHLFGDDLGIPLRRFVLWRRVRRAIRAIVDGESATHAAQVAGFHDSSHLTRTFKELLAVMPSQVARLRDQFDFVDEAEDGNTR